MPFRKITTLATLAVAVLLPGALLALNQLATPDTPENEAETTLESIPRPYPASRYQAIWKQSPFELDAAPIAVAAASRVSFTRDYSLVGTIKKGDSYTAYILNKRTKSTARVTQGKTSPEGFRLISVEPAGQGTYSAVVELGGERATLSYDQNEIQAMNQTLAESTATRRNVAAAAAASITRSGPNREEPDSPVSGVTINPAQQRLDRLRGEEPANQSITVPTPSSSTEAPSTRRRRVILPNSRSVSSDAP